MEILSKLLRTFINTHLSDSESVKLKEKILLALNIHVQNYSTPKSQIMCTSFSE